ncbi:hypothetical protein OPV22_028173 [Ensete ventricosum]|uniref:Uncharacterized protein n=1 Tax=Ensete ventricosum TaxID=4639 RepID=A0AAV8Q7S6_ENSVE|nr:hypothetical protein OPV22_028173 [Ensete ventricosum]
MGTFVRPYRRLLALRRLLPAPAAVGPLPTAYQERRGAEEPGDAVDCGEGRTVATARPSDRRASTLLGDCPGKLVGGACSTIYSSSNVAGLHGNVSDGYMAVFCAPIHAPQQVPVPSYSLPASPPGCALRGWSTLQPPIGGSPPRHLWRRHVVPDHRDDTTTTQPITTSTISYRALNTTTHSRSSRFGTGCLGHLRV